MPLFHPQRIAFCLLASLLLSGQAFACSITIRVSPFEPDVTTANRSVDLGHVRGPPPVTVQVGNIQRTSSMVDCDYEAEVDLMLAWAEPTALQWGDVGFYMHRVVREGGLPREGFFPEMAEIVDGKPHLTLRVPDYPSDGVLDFDVEIFAIDGGLRVGPPTRFHVHSDARPAHR